MRFDRIAKYVTCLTISLVLSATSFYGFALRPDAIGHWWLLLLGLVGGVDFMLGLYIGETQGAGSTLMRLGVEAGPRLQAGPLRQCRVEACRPGLILACRQQAPAMIGVTGADVLLAQRTADVDCKLAAMDKL